MKNTLPLLGPLVPGCAAAVDALNLEKRSFRCCGCPLTVLPRKVRPLQLIGDARNSNQIMIVIGVPAGVGFMMECQANRRRNERRTMNDEVDGNEM